MTKLEPTLTNSDLMATERLRELLDERGVEYRVSATGYSIDIGPYTTAYANRSDTTLDVSLRQVTPEQAIAAILGSCNCSNNCTNSERTGTLTAERVMAIAGKHQPDYCSDTHVCFDWQAIADELNATLGESPRLPHFWTHDGTLHIEATRMPTRIVVCEGGTCEFVPKRELYASEAENAKLRELVKALLTCATDGDCDECRLNGATPWHVGKAQLCDGVWDCLRELGVELDDA